jgi:transposase
MRKQRSFSELGFDRYDKPRLHKAIERVEDKRTYQRLKAVLLIAEGRNASEVSSIVDSKVSSIYRWVNMYLKDHRVEDLYNKPKTGRPHTAQQITDERIVKELRRNPMELGYFTNVWTVATLAKQLNSLYNCTISPRTLYRRMKAMGLECKRPKYFYEEKDPHRTQKKGPSFES